MMRSRSGSTGVTLRSALLLLVAVALLAGLLPAGILLEHWLARELERRAHRDVAMAPGLVSARDAALHDAMMMHAKELSHEGTLVAALAAGERAQAIAVVEPAARTYNYAGVLLGPDASVWIGPTGSRALAAETRTGGMPVRVVGDDNGLHLVSLAPVVAGDAWLGAAGVALPLDDAAASALAGLTHSDFVLLVGNDPRTTVSSGDSVLARQLVAAWSAVTDRDDVREITVADARYLVSATSLTGATALFVRDLRRELAILPVLRRVVLITGGGALAIALLLGYVLAGRIARPVRQLASAADRLSAGDFAAPLPAAPVRELARVTHAFAEMRTSLAARLDELRSANRLLEDRQARLSALQSELIKRERVATSTRMAAELAHEIRNPIANIRNCLELLERRLRRDDDAREFATLAIDELLRMHELAERMLHLNLPGNADTGTCDAVAVARDVIALSELRRPRTPRSVTLDAAAPVHVAMRADALKQVLLNLVQNARDAMPHDLALDIRIECNATVACIQVCDNGPGIPPELRDRIFDPFFTTRSSAGGIGLGLFLVEGIVRGHGGSVSLNSPQPARGACFELKIPSASDNVAATAQSGHARVAAP